MQALSPASSLLQPPISLLEKTPTILETLLRDVPTEILDWKPAPDRWSVAETLDIALAEDFIFQNVTDKITKAPAGVSERDIAKADAMVLAMTPGRTRKFQAPPPLKPPGRWTPAETLDHFQRSRSHTIEYLEATPDLRQHVVDSPLGQPLDAYEWLLFIGAHGARHTKQILEVKSDPNFPEG